MLLLAAGQIKFVSCVQLQFQNTRFLNAKLFKNIEIHSIHLYHAFKSSSVFQ